MFGVFGVFDNVINHEYIIYMANLWRQRNPELAKQKDKEYRLARLNDSVYIAKRALVQKNYALKVKARKGKRVKDCGTCGKPFEPKGAEKYCSAECIKRSKPKLQQRERNKVRSLVEYHFVKKFKNEKIKVCWVCGDEFSTLDRGKGSSGNLCAKIECHKFAIRASRKKETHKRRARGAIAAHTLTAKQWREALLFFNFKCAYCGKHEEHLHQEHVVPLSKGGEYSAKNIIPACQMCNSYKSNQDLDSWIEKQSFYSDELYFRILLYLATR